MSKNIEIGAKMKFIAVPTHYQSNIFNFDDVYEIVEVDFNLLPISQKFLLYVDLKY